MLSCDDIRDLGAAYPDGDLPWRTRLGIRVHLLLCGPCRDTVRRIRSLRRLLAGLPRLAPPTPVRARTGREFGSPLP
jgi:anti-sigma factor ChrR (cupin superfamily)